jgi:hypothetical protein
MYSQSEVYMALRQLEFSVLQLTRQIDALLAAVQYMILAKIPMAFISLTVLHSILRNVPFHFPQNYEFIAGTKLGNVHLYYNLINVAVMGKSRAINMIMSKPIRTANQQFTLYKLVVLPTRF